MKAITLQSVFFLLLLFAVNQSVAQEIEGGFSSTKYDIFVINDDESYHDAALRLQTRDGNSWKDWNIWNNRQDGKLFFSYWSGGSHSDANENDIGTYRMTLTSGGQLGIGATSPSAMLQVEASSSTSPASNGLYVYQSQTNQPAILSARVNANGSGDPFLSLDVNGESGWSVGLDNSDANKFKIAESWSALTSNTRFTIERGGEVGIGTTVPSQKLDVNGSTIIRSNLLMDDGDIYDVHGFQLKDWDDNSGGSNNKYRLLARDGAWMFYDGGMVVGSYGNGTWSDLASGTLIVKSKIGIGTTNPSEALEVNGTIKANRVTVNVGSFPDYVFAKDYKLLPLSEVEAYIKEHKHLPNVPAAAEIEKGGMDVGQLNVLMMEKIEELTLHLIQQQKLIEQQAKELESLKKQIKK